MPKHIDRKTLEALAKIQCTLVEMAAAFECHQDTVRKRILEFYDMDYKGFIEAYGANGKTSLRRVMWSTALKGNVKMQIWLSKQHLDMSDKSDVDNKHSGGVEITRIIDDVTKPD